MKVIGIILLIVLVAIAINVVKEFFDD